jgi:hypothetical protein
MLHDAMRMPVNGIGVVGVPVIDRFLSAFDMQQAEGFYIQGAVS